MICFCKICTISSFIPVPTDLISIHPHLRFSALKRFSPFHRSSDVSCVIHYFPAQSGYEKCPPPLERKTSFFYLLRLPRIRRTRHESVMTVVGTRPEIIKMSEIINNNENEESFAALFEQSESKRLYNGAKVKATVVSVIIEIISARLTSYTTLLLQEATKYGVHFVQVGI